MAHYSPKRILVYAPDENSAGERLNAVMNQRFRDGFKTADRMEGLVLNLNRPGHGFGIIVIQVNRVEQFYELEAITELLSDLRMILIIPNCDSNTISNAHALKPRFLTFADSDFSDVTGVLANMLK